MDSQKKGKLRISIEREVTKRSEWFESKAGCQLAQTGKRPVFIVVYIEVFEAVAPFESSREGNDNHQKKSITKLNTVLIFVSV